MSLSSIRLRYYTDDEIRALSVVRVTNPSSYDRGIPKTDGVNDARMGLIDHTVRCPTCFKANCDQHYGFIELERPVYRLGSVNTVIMALRCLCRECAKPKFAVKDLVCPDALLKLPGILAMAHCRERLRLLSEACRTKMTCNWCGAPQPIYTKRDRTFVDATYRPKELSSEFVKSRGPEYIQYLKSRFLPDDSASILSGLHKAVALALGIDRPESLLCKLQIVPPPVIRPSNFMGESKVRSENDLTIALQDIVRANTELQSVLQTKAYEQAYDKLQIMVSGVVNHAIKRTAAQQGLLPLVTATSKRKVIDLKCRLNGKKARVRGNLNGKRVDQSGRTVISGDASHDIDELGVPSAMMNKLTFPEHVTQLNVAQLAKCVVLGAYINGGALAVRPPGHSTDHVIWLPILDNEARIDLASQLRPGWIVERHLIDGDWVLFNRQPSLWKASMMAFKCYRVPGLTCRLPLPVTRAFNADFDGDEMNIHALQGYEAIAEAQELMAVSHQIVSPQSNSVIIGLVQDSLVGAYRLSAQDCFFEYETATELLTAQHYEVPGRRGSFENYSDSNVRSKYFVVPKMPEPAILKGTNLKKPLYTGLQLVSLLMPTNISYCKGSPDISDLTTSNGLVIRNGTLFCGRLVKSHFSSSGSGLVYAIWRHYGPGGAHKFISDAQRLFVKHLAHDGPTQSILDCLVGSEETTLELLSKNLGRSDAVLSLDLPESIKEAKSSAILQETLRSVGASVLATVRTECALANCVNSGSKGNVMNIAQIGGCVGQQTVYGRRVPWRQTRLGPRTLMYYSPGDARAESRGFISNSYVSGLTPAEFFEHQMAGREGIVATAVNTSESGYNQRRMIKGQESQCLGYDGTVRVSSNIIVQTSYGGDDLDGSRLERVKISWLFDLPEKLKGLDGVFQKALVCARRYVSWKANLLRDTDFQLPCGVGVQSVLYLNGTTESYSGDLNENILRIAKQALGLHARHHSSKKTIFNISVAALVLQCAEHWPLSEKAIAEMFRLYSKAIANPGEGVGALGATSIGEPSMQMTLNVFHYAGISDKNVTITGLPRFKQLINGVNTYETANMTAALKDFVHQQDALQTSTVKLNELLIERPHKILVDHVHPVFESFGQQRGPMSTKFGFSEKPTSFKIVLHISWIQCIRRSIKSATIAKSLRDTLSYDAHVVEYPFWTSGPGGPNEASRIDIFFAPWITQESIDSIIESITSHLQVRGIEYVKNTIVFQETWWSNSDKCSRHVVETEGSNITGLAKCPFILPESIRSNNVVEVAQVLGISAGLCILQSELHKVLSFDSSYIDPRHTWLLTDTMGRSGSLAAMNRHHMETLGSSLLQRASFEQSLDVFEEGASFGISDPLAGATERIITGQPVSIGTGLVGIVSMAKTAEEQPEILVAPLKDKMDESDTIVGPLTGLFTKQERFDAVHFSMKLTEASKSCNSAFLEECAMTFRETAASRRAIPSLRIYSKLNENQFKHALASCWKYSYWTLSESSDLVTEVSWSHKQLKGLTVVSKDKIPVSNAIDTFKSLSSDKITCDIFVSKTLAAQEVPFGTESTEVFMRQQSRFVKGPFALTLARQWSGANNTEAEAAVLGQRGLLLAILDIIDGDSILQNRCSDAQLGNSLMLRIPM